MFIVNRQLNKIKILIGCDPETDCLFETHERSFYVSPSPYHKPLKNLQYFGNDDEFLAVKHESSFEINFGLDSPSLKLKLYRNLKLSGYDLISSSALVNESAQWGEGLMSQHRTFIGPHTNFGKFVKLNIGAQIHHDVQIGDFCTIAPGALILGSATIGSSTFIGAGSIIMPHISIGEGVVVGAGAVVTRNVDSGGVVVGVPAKGKL